MISGYSFYINNTNDFQAYLTESNVPRLRNSPRLKPRLKPRLRPRLRPRLKLRPSLGISLGFKVVI